MKKANIYGLDKYNIEDQIFDTLFEEDYPDPFFGFYDAILQRVAEVQEEEGDSWDIDYEILEA